MSSFLAQAVQPWRSAKTPALFAVLALTLGIGSTTAIFTIINGVMLRPVPYEHPERWVALFGGSPRDPKSRSSLTVSDLTQYQQRARSFEVFGWLWFLNVNLTSPGIPQHLEGVAVTPSLVNQLGVNPQMGRWFPVGVTDPVVVISHPLWQRLGSGADIIGKSLTLNGRPHTVSGVMPVGFRFPLAGPAGDVRSDIWLPLDPQGRRPNMPDGYFGVLRRRPGVTLSAAQAEVQRIAADIARAEPGTHPDYTARLDGLLEIVLQEIRPTLLLLFAAAGALMLITCANVAGLMVARSVERARETAIRVALGATRGRLAWQYFQQSMLISLLGACGGVAATGLFVRLIVSQTSNKLPLADQIAIDWKVLMFSLAAACVASALASLAPLWQAVHVTPNEVLSEGVRASSSAHGRRLIRILVVAEIALSYLLLISASTLLMKLQNLNRTSPGFVPDQLLTFQLTLPESIVRHGATRNAFHQRLLQALEAIPGVSNATFVNQLPLAGCCLVLQVYPQERQPDFRVEKTSFLVASPGYFATMRIPVHRGRLLNDRDTNEQLIPVVINEAAAKLYWPNRDAVGAFGQLGAPPKGDRFQVVGIVGDVRNEGLGQNPIPEFYLPSILVPANPLYVIVRSTLPLNTLTNTIARTVQSVDKDHPVHNVRTMPEIVYESMAVERVGSWVTMFFAFAALLMAALGIYGVVAYSTRQRTVEMGTRMALGAERSDLLRLVLGSGVKMAVVGVVIGGGVAAAVGPYLMRMLAIHDIGFIPTLISTVTVTGVSLLASFFPAWRATMLSPMVAIRNEPSSMWEAARQRLHKAMHDLGESGQDEPAVAEGALAADFLSASRQSSSFREALHAMLAALCSRIGAQSAILLERTSDHSFQCTASTGDASGSLPANGFLDSRLRFLSGPLPLSPADYDALRIWANENKPEAAAEIDTLQQAGARMAIALRTSTEAIGILLMGAPASRDVYSQHARRVLEGSVIQFALMLENARLTDRIVEQEKVHSDLALAAEVQKRLLPQKTPVSSAATFAVVSQPARSVGGDYYDFLELPGNRIGIAQADVAGKGVAAALLMSIVQASLRLIAAEDGVSLPQLTGRMNRFLKQTMGSNRTSFATFFYATFDEQTKEMHYVNAGHSPPLVMSAGRVQALPVRSLVIGMFPKAEYLEGRLALSSGDVLLVFTDGVTEARNAEGEEFGDERLSALLHEAASLAASGLAQRIKSELDSWTQDAAQHDDITFVVMKVS